MKAGLIENLAPLTATGTVHLIALERDPYDTIVSFRNRYDFIDPANRWLWYLDPDYPRNLVPSHEFASYGLNGVRMWYILEMRARAARYESLLSGQRGIMFHHFGLEELSGADGVLRLMHALGVPVARANARIPPPENVGHSAFAIIPAEEAQIREIIAASAAILGGRPATPSAV